MDRDMLGHALGGLHHVQLPIPPGAEELCREFWGGVLGMTELEKPPVLAARGGCWFRGVSVTRDDDFPGHDRFHACDKLGNRLEFLEPARDC